jgi:putative transposase
MSLTTSRGEAPVTLVCETFRVSRAAYYAARKPAVPRPPTQPPRRTRGTPAATLLAAIERVVSEHPAWGVRKVWATLKREGMRVGRRRVWALMRAHGHVLAGGTPREPSPRRGHVVVPEPNRRLATDFTTVWTARHGLVAIAITVDCGCRTALDVTVIKSQDAPSMLASVDNALVLAFGTPENVPFGVEIRSDHGSVYTGADAHTFALRWGIEQTFAPVGRPTGNAVAERTIRTMKEECIWLADWSDMPELRAALNHWRRQFNEVRPHQSLNWATPAEYRAAYPLGRGICRGVRNGVT